MAVTGLRHGGYRTPLNTQTHEHPLVGVSRVMERIHTQMDLEGSFGFPFLVFEQLRDTMVMIGNLDGHGLDMDLDQGNGNWTWTW